MRFINKYILLFLAIVLPVVICFYLLLEYALETKAYNYTAILSISYFLIIFCSAFIIGRRDIYEGYYGFNYHFLTYIICNAVPLILVNTGSIDPSFEHSTYTVMLTWGIGVFVHFIIYLWLRKRSLKGFDKKELFD